VGDDGQRQLEIYDQKLTANRGSGERRKPVTNPDKLLPKECQRKRHDGKGGGGYRTVPSTTEGSS